MSTPTATNFSLTLTDEERAELLRLLENSVVETHVESRRTESPEYQKEIHHEEAVLRSLLAKVRRLG
jgi:hypothetical protein